MINRSKASISVLFDKHLHNFITLTVNLKIKMINKNIGTLYDKHLYNFIGLTDNLK